MNSYVLSFDGFGQESLASEASLGGAQIGDVLQLAVRHYLSELGSDRFSLRVPAFARRGRRKPGMEIGLDLSESDLSALESEADRQGLAVEDLIGHAAIFYLADRD